VQVGKIQYAGVEGDGWGGIIGGRGAELPIDFQLRNTMETGERKVNATTHS